MRTAGTYEYTLNMESIFEDKFSALKSYYCREDFVQALEDVRRARSDAREFRMRDLKRLCRARDIDAEALLKDDALLEMIPTREQMQDHLLQAFYDMYASFPKTTDFMERIVRRLAPEYRNDTVRTAILKKFLAGAGTGFKRFHTEQILEWGKKRLTGEEKKRLDTLSQDDQQALIFSRIDDSVFEHKTVALSGVDIFRLIAGRIKKYREDEGLAFVQPELSAETCARLDDFLKGQGIDSAELSAGEKIAEILAVLDAGRISGDEAEIQISVFIDGLERDFRNQLKNIPRISKTGAAGTAADLYKQAKKDALTAARAEAKKTEPDYELLDMCSDLVAGNFRVNGKTKVYLYYFAIMFGMDMPVEDADYEHDKKWFEHLKENLNEVLPEMLDEKQKEYRRLLKEAAEGLSSEETEKRLHSLSREHLYRLRRALYGVAGCCDLYELMERPTPADTAEIRAALKNVQALIDVRDIEKSLFQDFYNDNLLRFLEGNYTDSRMASAFEKEPTGEGINYKSFVEAIYLYFICHEELDMTPGERIDTAESIIESCIEMAKKAGAERKHSASEHTQMYKDCHINILVNKNVDEIAKYVVDNYLVISPENMGAARIMVASEENTAFDLIGEIVEDLDAVYPEVELFYKPGKGIRDNQNRRKGELFDAVKADISFQTAFGFDWKVKTLLEEKYAEDRDFLKVVAAIDERVRVQSGRYSRSQRIRMITLLFVLAAYSDASVSLSADIIRERMADKGVISAGMQQSSALSALKEIGYDIQRDGERYFLGKRQYDDPEMNALLERVSGRYLVIDEDMELLMAELLVRRMRYDKRVTRSELISIHFNYYIALLNETEGLDTFPEVFEDYDTTISPILEEARYQPLSEKNILDMYVVMALYFYLVENNGYM